MDPHTIRRFEREGPESHQGRLMKLAHSVVLVASVCFVMFGAAAVQAQESAKAVPSKPAPESSPTNVTGQPSPAQKIVEQGIAIEFTIDPQKEKATRLRAGEDAIVKIKVTDTTTGTPVKGLSFSVWMSLRAGDKAPDMKQCREKIQSFLGGTLRERPDIDLNSYYILALNGSPDISVIDPLLGFGGSKLLALVMLKSSGEDWVLSRDREELFVTMPLVNQVAVVDTRTWALANYVDTGVKPMRITLQPDQKYLWVANDGNKEDTSGVTVIDALTLKMAAQISTGAGHHEVVISGDNRFAFVSNRESGTISIIDVRKLAKTGDVKVSPNPVSMALSELSKAIYVASESEGTITVIDEQNQRILARLNAKPGLRSIRFAPGGRYGFAVNTKQSTVSIFDAASNRILHEVKVGKAPDQVIFSDTFAFVRSLGTENVAMIRLATLGTDVEITDFPGGQTAPEKASSPVRADSIVLAPEGNSVILANPSDKVIYYYAEGMAAPMGDFQNYGREPRAILVVDRSLRETTPGVYSTMVKFPASGKYDVAFLADSPRIAHCFEAAAEPNPLLKQERQIALRIDYQIKVMKLPVGQDFPLRFKLIETATSKARDDLKDVRVLTYSGAWQRRDNAKSIGGGVYEVNLNVPEPGAYMVFVESPSMRVRYKDLPQLMLQATGEKTVPPSGQSNAGRKP
jgi:DNA-binding beta-propeller fold protein YncE